MMEIRAVLFDFIGTTVIEQVPNTISRCFEIAFAMNGIIVTEGFIEANRGKNKREAMELAIEKFNCHAPADRVLRDFESALKDNLHNFTAEPNAQILFHQLKAKRIKIGLGTGLTRDSFNLILNHLGWNSIGFDYTATSEEIGKGRPHPDMIFDMMKKLNITNPKHILKIGDTISDIEEGKNAGVWTAALLSGTQPKEKILAGSPDFVLEQLDLVGKIIS